MVHTISKTKQSNGPGIEGQRFLYHRRGKEKQNKRERGVVATCCPQGSRSSPSAQRVRGVSHRQPQTSPLPGRAMEEVLVCRVRGPGGEEVTGTWLQAVKADRRWTELCGGLDLPIILPQRSLLAGAFQGRDRCRCKHTPCAWRRDGPAAS